MSSHSFVTHWTVDAPIARPVFEWNHDVIMRWGLEGLEERLARR